jgi:hypothetical protein
MMPVRSAVADSTKLSTRQPVAISAKRPIPNKSKPRVIRTVFSTPQTFRSEVMVRSPVACHQDIILIQGVNSSNVYE